MAAFKVEHYMTMMTKLLVIKWLRWIYQWQIQRTLPNIIIALWLFLTLTVSVVSTERSFSKLNLIKSYLRWSMLQDCLSNLSLISIEHETVEKIDFDHVINNFAFTKV